MYLSVVRNIQLIFLSVNLEGLKSLRFCGLLTITRGSGGDITYMFCTEFSNFNLDCLSRNVYVLLFHKQKSKYRTKKTLAQHFIY